MAGGLWAAMPVKRTAPYFGREKMKFEEWGIHAKKLGIASVKRIHQEWDEERKKLTNRANQYSNEIINLMADLQASLDTSDGLYDQITDLQQEKGIVEARLQDAEYRWQCERGRRIKLEKELGK